MATNNHWHVVVVGGGMSGVCAATAAARNGLSVLLVERDGSLGGTMTNGLVGPMMTFHSPTAQVVGGLAQEIVDRLVALGGSPGHITDTSRYVETITPFDAEAMKLVCQRIVLEAGGTILYNTVMVAVLRDGSVVRGIEVVNKGGISELYGDILIDCTGDADLAYDAGVPCDFGRPSDGGVQPVSLMFKVSHVDAAALRAHLAAHAESLLVPEGGLADYLSQPLNKTAGFQKEFQEAIANGELFIEREHILFFNTLFEDEVIVNTSRLTDVNPLDPWQLSVAEGAAREQVVALFDFMRSHIPGFAQARLATVGQRVGVRESRRILGEYTLTEDDIYRERTFEDGVARCAFPVDLHAVRPGESEYGDYQYQGETYEIPYRCLVPMGAEQLLVAGRSISTTHGAQASIRTSPTVMALGQAAGTAAALALRTENSPRQVDGAELRVLLRRQGALI
jgi:hypothetical protein